MALSVLSLLFGREFKRLETHLREIDMKLAEVGAAVQAIGAQLEKAKNEILSRIAGLEQQLENTDFPPEAELALENLRTAVQALDDIVPDAPVEEAPA